ncbi:hypothetical protein [Rhizobium sp. Root1220]|uniref:hypothetical protein n=1 Tax=Rhizobium sp. Root1220 TaxID=1736432 RepID=UPI0006F4D60E|nr:hypothetical protein [Rhizobium sp. Root1220]KQV80043.1 hypothetical protein ASC90_25930 [Rhizobium sp. Root1220]
MKRDIEWELTAPEIDAYRLAKQAGFELLKNPDAQADGYLLADDRNCVVFGSEYSADLDDILLWLAR